MAVYTPITDAQVRTLLALYNIGELQSLKGIEAGVENSNYRVETTGEVFILTLYEKRVRPDDLPFYLGLMSHLEKAGFPCPKVIAAKDGSTLQTIEGRPAALVSFLKGAEAIDITAQHCFKVGQRLAQLHHLGRDFPLTRENDLSLPGWHHLHDICTDKVSEIFPTLPGFIKQELDWLDRHWPTQLPSSAIHADLFPDNVFFDDDQLIGVIDFYFACTDFLAYDLAIAANAWCFDEEQYCVDARFEALLEGYNSIRQLTADERRALPILLRGSALRFLLTRAHDWVFPQEGAIVKAKDPMDYQKRLRHWQHWDTL